MSEDEWKKVRGDGYVNVDQKPKHAELHWFQYENFGRIRMKVKYMGESDPLELIHGKVYDVLSVEKGWYRIIDETEEDYLYPPQAFEIVEK